MKHVIIGTAGHVDHGKTRLIQALTGIDTDRLPEEKQRGMTIELGFAHLELEDGTQVGIVDVPGHEKFIRQMLSGAGGVDLAMLVVSADEGVMPQTLEHLQILTMLGIQEGLIVLTKTDLAEPWQQETAAEEIRQAVRGTFLEGKPLLPVSARTGDGIPALQECLSSLVHSVAERDRRSPFRLPIDRIFSVDGFGTVVTGTLMEGHLRQNDPVELLPSGILSRVRTLQVHGTAVSSASAGQRVAVNLANVKREELNRGDTLAQPGSLPLSRLLDVRLQNLPQSGRILRSQSQLHLYHGASAILCRVVLLDAEELSPGESGYAQLRLASPLPVKRGDRFVVRFFSPLETVGGGVVLDESPRKHKRHDDAVLQALQIRESGSVEQRFLQTLSDFGCTLPGRKKLSKTIDETDFDDVLQNLLRRGKVLEPLPGRFLSVSSLEALHGQCSRLLQVYHDRRPLSVGMPRIQLRQALFPASDPAVGDAILSLLVQAGNLRLEHECYAAEDFQIQLTKHQQELASRILALYQTGGLRPPSPQKLRLQFPKQEAGQVRQILDYLIASGQLAALDPETVYHAETFRAICQAADAWFQTHETLTLGQFRDLLGTSRDSALVILEYFDRCRMTCRDGNIRTVGTVSFPNF